MGRVTLRQIAAEAGLSTFAVSRALSGKDGVGPPTREAVRRVAERLGYVRPRPTAGAATGGSHDIGVIFPDSDPVNSELHMQIQGGVQAEARRLGRTVRLQSTHDPAEMLDVAGASAGLLLVGTHGRANIEAARSAGVPVVRLGWIDPLEPVDQVAGTDREAAAAVADYLVGLGHERIAFVHGAPGLRGRAERLNGLRDALVRHRHVRLRAMRFDEREGFARAFQAVRRSGFRPTAFFCAHDGLALTVVTELLGQGYRIPGDASVVGFGDYSAATQISPQLTTVRVEGREMGAVALRLLIERIERAAEPVIAPRRILIASRIIERQSSGARPVASAGPGASRPGRR